jgi:hypothetical protein
MVASRDAALGHSGTHEDLPVSGGIDAVAIGLVFTP